MRAQYPDLTNDEEAGLGAGGGAAGADLRAAGGLVSLREKQPGGRYSKIYTKAIGRVSPEGLIIRGEVVLGGLALPPHDVVRLLHPHVQTVLGSTVWLLIVTNIMSWCQRREKSIKNPLPSVPLAHSHS